MTERILDAVVVGAGAAGLAAARVLARAGASFLIVEARSRPGGRILTERVAGVPVELGAEFVHGRPFATFRVLNRAGLTARRVPEGRAGGARDPARWGDLKRIVRRLAPKGPDVSFARALAELSEAPERKAAVARFVQGFDAADLNELSARDVAESAGELDGASRSYRIEEGYDGLTLALLGQLPAGALKRRAVVERIEWGGETVVVGLKGGGELTARAAVVTLPVGVLRASPGEEGAVSFEPALPEDKRRAVGNLRMGDAARVSILFKPEYWPAISKKFREPFLDADGGRFSVFWTAAPFDRPLATAWAGGPPARGLGALSRVEVAGAAVAGLAKALAVPILEVGAGARAALFHDWTADPFSRGAYSYLAAGGAGAREELARPCGRLFFAGEACDLSGQSGTVAGALQSGAKAAKALLEKLRR